MACLASFLPIATDAGMMAIIACSDPSDAIVAPYGGKRAVFMPDPIAVRIPTDGDPILIDISASITTAGMSSRLRRSGERFQGACAIDAQCRPTDDPNVLTATPKGTLPPVGGLDHGHKCYGLALMVEALTQGLSGHGRVDREDRWRASVFIQVFDPEAFVGLAEFVHQTSFTAAACLDNPPISPDRPVRCQARRQWKGCGALRRMG
jgi:LDH2 family malate/lactate/ureidoglycolate dehydrogenase